MPPPCAQPAHPQPHRCILGGVWAAAPRLALGWARACSLGPLAQCRSTLRFLPPRPSPPNTPLYPPIPPPRARTFSRATSSVALNIFTDLVFLLDLGLNFFTGVVIHRELVWSRGRIARRYLSTWFVLDLLSSFPSNAIPTDDRLSLVKGLRLLRMGRLTRLGRMKTVKDLERHARVPPGLVRLCKLTMTYVTFTHWLACTYHVIAVTTTTSSECAGASGNYSAATGLLTRDTWGVCPDITSQPVAVQWMSAYYWTVTAMLGEEWSPDTATRQLFSIALIITGQVLNAVVVRGAQRAGPNGGPSGAEHGGWRGRSDPPFCAPASHQSAPASHQSGPPPHSPCHHHPAEFTVHCPSSPQVGACASLLSNLDGRATVRQQLITDLGAFLTHHKVPYKLAGRLRSYFEHKWEWGVSVDEETLLAEVPLKLRRQLTIVSHRQLVRSSELLSALTEPQCILAIIESLEQQLMPPAEYVIIQRQRAHHLYLIQRGLVQVTQFEARDDYMREHPLRQLGPGALFGEVGLLSEAGRRTANVLTLRYCEFLTLTGEVLERLMRSFPALRELMQQRKNAMTVANRFCCWRQRTRKIRIAASSSEAAPDLADAAPALSSTGGAAPDRTRAEAPGAKAPGGAPSSTPSRRRTPRKGQSCSREDALARTLRDYVDGQPQSNTAPAPPVDTRRSRVAVSSTLDRQ